MNRIDASLLRYGMVPTRADRCVYVLYKDEKNTSQGGAKHLKASNMSSQDYSQRVEEYMEKLLAPDSGSLAEGKSVLGVICLHVDDLFMTGSKEFYSLIGDALRKEYQIGSEDRNDVVFTGQRVSWKSKTVVVDQDKAVEELSEIDREAS